MKSIEYKALNQVDPDPLLSLLNKESVRSHLMNHHLKPQKYEQGFPPLLK